MKTLHRWRSESFRRCAQHRGREARLKHCNRAGLHWNHGGRFSNEVLSLSGTVHVSAPVTQSRSPPLGETASINSAPRGFCPKQGEKERFSNENSVCRTNGKRRLKRINKARWSVLLICGVVAFHLTLLSLLPPHQYWLSGGTAGFVRVSNSWPAHTGKVANEVGWILIGKFKQVHIQTISDIFLSVCLFCSHPTWQTCSNWT